MADNPLVATPEAMSDEDIRAVNINYMASKTNRAPSQINYDAEKNVFFGKDYSDQSAYYDVQQAEAGTTTDWSEYISGVLNKEQQEYAFWGTEPGQRIKEGIEMGDVMSKSIMASGIDIIPSWIRGTTQFTQQIGDITGDFGKAVGGFLEELGESPFIATMLDTPLRFITESGELNKETHEELRRMSERHGKTAVVANELSKAVVDTTMFLATMRAANVKIGATPSQAANQDLSRQMLARLQSAGKLGLFRAVTSEAETMQERVDIGAITAMYMSTPAASGMFESARDVFVADLILNSSITAPQIMELWKREDMDDFDKILESVKMVGADIAFSAMTKTMRGNRMSPNWKPMAEASRKLVETGKKTVWEAEADRNALITETDRLAELNSQFSNPENIPKPGDSLNRVEGASDTAERSGSGYIKVEQERANAEADIRALEEKLTAEVKEQPRGDEAPEQQKQQKEATDTKKKVLETINETRELPVEERIDAINRVVHTGEKPKTSKIKQRAEATTGVKPKQKRIVVNEYQMLKKQLRDINRGVKEGKKLGKAEQKVTQLERDAKLASLHKDANEYVNSVVKSGDARKILKHEIPKIKTVEGLDKFQSKVNKVLAEQARTHARTEANDAVKKLTKTKLGTELRGVADELLSGIDIKGTGDKKLSQLREVKEFLEKEGIEIMPETAEKMDVLEKLRLKDMTTADLKDLKNVADAIVHMQKQKEALTKQGQNKVVEQKATEYVAEQRPERMADSGLTDEKGNRIDVKTGGLLATKRMLDLTPNALLFYLDGGREGAAHELYVRNIWAGDDKRLRIEQEAHKYINPFKDDIKGWNKATAKEGFKTKLGGENATISKAEKIAIYLDSLNEGNSRHVREGGYVINEKVVKPSQAELDRIIESVQDSPVELQVASAIHRGYQNILRPAINEASNKVNGYDIANVDNYHPMNTVRTAGEKESTPATMREYTEVLLDSSGHFKKRTGGLQPIKLQDAIDKFDKITKLVSRYNGYAEPIALQKKFLDGKSADGTSVRDVITRTYGKQYVKALETLTKDLEAGGHRDISRAMQALNKGIMHVGRGYLALNVSVAAGQPVSYLTAGNVIPIEHWRKGNVLAKNVPWDEMAEHSSLLWSRGQGHLDIAFGESVEAKKLSRNMAMIRAMDHRAISMIWRAAESWVRAETGSVDPKKVAEKVDDVVRRTQPTFETIDRPEIARDPNFRFASMFSSVINKNHALKFTNDINALEQMKRGEWDNQAKTEWMRKSMLNRVLTPAVYSAIKTATSMGFLNDLLAEDENSFIKRWANKFADASIGEMGIIASKIGQFIKYIVSKKSEFVTGQEQNMPGTRELEDIGLGLAAMVDFATRQDEDLNYLKSEKQLEREAEADKKMIQRLIRGTLALGGKGYQNLYDWGKLGFDIATKEEKDEL